MPNPRRTTTTFWRPVYLCFLAVASPSQLAREEQRENETNPKLADVPKHSRPEILFRAFWCSLGLVVVSALVGYLASSLLGHFFGRMGSHAVVALQVVGAMLLLWGTLFVRGWEIQSWGGITLTERVNRWLYRALYCFGTAIIIFSLGLPS